MKFPVTIIILKIKINPKLVILIRQVFKIYLGLAVNSARNEQSFSKLKLNSTYLRQSQNQERLSALAIISFEKET